jgi:hypothetical protein
VEQYWSVEECAWVDCPRPAAEAVAEDVPEQREVPAPVPAPL